MTDGAFCPRFSARRYARLRALRWRARCVTQSMRAAPRRLLASYDDFAASLVAEGILSDPWVDGAPRFRMTPLAIDRATQAELYAAAEAVAAVHAEAAWLCAAQPELVARYFDPPPSYRLMWGRSDLRPLA